MAGWVHSFSLELAPLPALNSEIGIRTLFLKTTQSKGKPLDLFRVIGMEGWGITELLSNPVLDNPVHFIDEEIKAQLPKSSRLEPWHQALAREAVFSGLYLHLGPGHRFGG